MPTNILIADDEFFIRQRLKKIIPWTNLNLTFAGEAENGLEVIEALKKQLIHIIILDIKMPKMDGISVAEYVHSNYPFIKIIILSGYNDFEYARSTMRYGITDYLLKPVDAETLTAALMECMKKLEDLQKQEKKIRKYYHYEKCTALSNVLNGNLDVKDLLLRYPEFQDISHSLFIGVYSPNASEHTVHQCVTQLRNAGYTCEYFQEAENIHTIQMFFKNRSETAHLGSLLTDLLIQEKNFVFFSVGTLYELEENWLPYHKRMIHGLKMRYFSSNSELFLEYAAVPEKNYSQELPKIRHKATLLLNDKNEKEFCFYIEELFDSIRNKKCVDYLYTLMMELFMTYHICHQNPGSSYHIHELVTSLLDEEYNLNELQNIAFSYGLKCMEQNNTQPSDVALSKKLIVFIEEHYAESDLTVAKIADAFQLNSSYIGTAFKKANSLSILQYITNIRMEASLRLLETNQYKISEIAERVGYSDVFYFSKRFKKTFGYPPKNYALHS